MPLAEPYGPRPLRHFFTAAPGMIPYSPNRSSPLNQYWRTGIFVAHLRWHWAVTIQGMSTRSFVCEYPHAADVIVISICAHWLSLLPGAYSAGFGGSGAGKRPLQIPQLLCDVHGQWVDWRQSRVVILYSRVCAPIPDHVSAVYPWPGILLYAKDYDEQPFPSFSPPDPVAF